VCVCVCVCVCFEVTSDAPPTVLTNILPVRKHQFATVALGSWPNDGALEGVICVRYTDRMSESDLNTDSLRGCYRSSGDKVEKESSVDSCLRAQCIPLT
jgi:hypothetical protein